MQHPEVEGQFGEVDVLTHRIAGGLRRFVEGVEVGAGLHFHHRVALPVIEIEISAVLQEGAAHRHGPLVIERRPVDEEWRHAVEAEAVVQPIGVFRVLFVDDIRDHDVADARAEGRGLTEDVDTPKCGDAFGHFAQDVVGAQSKGVVDVDQDRRAPLQPVRGRGTQSGVEVARHQPVEDDDLRRHVEASLAGKEKDAPLLFLPRPMSPALPRLGGLRVVGARGVVQKVVPVAARLALPEFA